MNLREYYRFLKEQPRPKSPAEQFISDLAIRTNRSEKTVTQWIYGCQPIPEEFKNLIREIIETGTTPTK